MNDDQVTHAMSIDDAYRVSWVLAQGADGVTELVTIDGAGPFVRKRIPAARARRAVWAALADCRCDRLPRVRATYETPDDFVVVCDYVEGPTLEEAVAARGRLPLDEAARMAADLCAATAALHAQGVAHCDIAPGNVILADDGAHLIDLGIARVMGAGGEACGAPDPGRSLGTWGLPRPSSTVSRRRTRAPTSTRSAASWPLRSRARTRTTRALPRRWRMPRWCRRRCAR